VLIDPDQPHPGRFNPPATTGLDAATEAHLAVDNIVGTFSKIFGRHANEGPRAQVIGHVLARLRAFLLRDLVRQVVGPPVPDLPSEHGPPTAGNPNWRDGHLDLTDQRPTGQ
jgi:hypothetical protein